MKIYWFLSHEQFQPEVLVEHARMAEEVGFDGVMASEHFHPWVDDAGASGYTWSTLGAIAAVTSKLELMTAVTSPLWRQHPGVVAQAAATVGRLSGGRFTLGIGMGENLNEAPLGWLLPPYEERAARMREAIGIMRGLLDGERVDQDGTYYRTQAAKLYSPSPQRVPIYLAAGGPKTAALAGETTDGVIVSVKSTDQAQEKVLQPAATAAQQAGRERPAIVAMHWTVQGKNDEEAWQAMRAQRGLRAPSRATQYDPAKLRAEADALPRQEILSKFTRVQTAADYLKTYGEIAAALQPDVLGIQTTSVDQTATIQMLGREVLPQLRGGGR